MKKSVLTSVVLGALAVPCAAFAADLAVKAPALGRPAVMTWTGCHVGGHVGWGWSRHNIDETGQTNPTAGPGPIPFTATGSLDTSGGMFGGQVGCDYQFASNWVVGIEGMAAATDFNGSSLDPGALGPIGGTNFNHVKSDWLASITGRIGYSYQDTLYYVKGGGAWTRNRWNIAETMGFTGLPTSSLQENVETRTGWTIGAGAEWMWSFAPKWSSFVEYDYYDFGGATLFSVPMSATLTDTVLSMRTNQTAHTAKFGVNYRFGN